MGQQLKQRAEFSAVCWARCWGEMLRAVASAWPMAVRLAGWFWFSGSGWVMKAVGGSMSGASDSSRIRSGGSWRKTSSTADLRACKKWPENEKNAPSGIRRRAVSMEPLNECIRKREGGGATANASNNAPHALRQWMVSGRSSSRASCRWAMKIGRWTSIAG